MPDSFWIFFALAWIAEGLSIGYFMGRRGYDAYAWMVIGFVFGPISLGIAVFYVRQSPSRAPLILKKGGRRGGTLDVLVGVDGSPASEQGPATAKRLFGDLLGSMTVARVVPVDSTPDALQIAEENLSAVAAIYPELDVSTVLLRGEPAVTLREYAARSGCDLLVIGKRGRGRSMGFLGSVAGALAGGAGLPVLLVDDAASQRESRAA